MKVNISYFFILFFIFCFIKKYAQNDLIKNTLKGIDVSHHQGIILWDSVLTENISFAIVSAASGRASGPTLLANSIC